MELNKIIAMWIKGPLHQLENASDKDNKISKIQKCFLTLFRLLLKLCEGVVFVIRFLIFLTELSVSTSTNLSS
jgi:hypothetical protein